MDKCLQALRRGTVVIADALQQPGAAAAPHPHHDEDAEAGEVLQRLRDGAIAGLYRAALGVMGGDGEDAELGGYPHVLLDHLDALGFQPLTLVRRRERRAWWGRCRCLLLLRPLLML